MKPVIRTKFCKLDINNFYPQVREKALCPKCNNIIKKRDDKFVSRCTYCGLVYCFFSPTPIQNLILNDNSRFLVLVGGFGSGKSVIDALKIQKHMLVDCPGASVAVSAQVKTQLHENFKSSILEKFFLDEWFVIKNNEVWKLTNGSKIIFLASDDQQKLRSAEYTKVVLIEASVPKFKPIADQLATRLRHPKVITYAKDSFGNTLFKKDKFGSARAVIEKDDSQLILESNPVRGFLRDDYILKSHRIVYTTHTKGVSELKELSIPGKRSISTYIYATIDNPMITEDYIKETFANKPQHYIDRNMYADFSDSNSLILGDILKHKIEPFSIPPFWPRFCFMDPGIADPFAISWIAMDPKTRILYLYDTYYKINKTPIEVINDIAKIEKRNGTNRHNLIDRTVDPAARKRAASLREKNISLIDIFKQLGMDLIPGVKSGNKMDDVLLLRGMIKIGWLKWFSNLTDAQKEFSGYTWPTGKDETELEQKLPTRGDHIIDTIRQCALKFGQDPRTFPLPKQFSNIVLEDDIARKFFNIDANKQNNSSNRFNAF